MSLLKSFMPVGLLNQILGSHLPSFQMRPVLPLAVLCQLDYYTAQLVTSFAVASFPEFFLDLPEMTGMKIFMI